jgi:hypothetical protein
MESNNSNPLAKYFRAATTSTRIPSMGNFQAPGNIGFTATGEVAVMAMRAADEMIMKSPDALMSGLAVETLLRSCVPEIKDVHQLPTPDVDTLLLAIRCATYGSIMKVETECPKCQAINEYDFDITFMLDTVTPLEKEYSIRITDDIVIYVKPFTFRSTTQISTAIFQETRKMQLIDQTPDVSDEERQRQMNASFSRLHSINIQMIAESVEKIVVPEGVITNRDHISEYIFNIDKNISSKIEEKIKQINNSGLNKNHTVTCASCTHEWETIVEFDPASFFEQNS